MSWLTKFFKFREKSDGDIVKPFLDHMEDLRWTIIKMVAVQVLMMVISFYFRHDLMNLLRAPLYKVDPELPGKLIITNIAGSFLISLELAFFAGIAMAFPFHVYFVAHFVLPALTRKERKLLLPGIFGTFLLFLAGVLVAYLWILPQTIGFFYRDAHNVGLTVMWTWNDYFSFSAWLCFGFGLLCELPVIVILLGALGIVNFQFLSRTRPFGYTIILILAAVIAPTPDPLTFVALSVPIVALFEACIWVVWLIDRRRRRERERAERDLLD
ncbi:MAG: twin-arginine translocase subunit TatC [Chthoniobacter sp.]